MVDKIMNAQERVKIAVVGKYTELADSYKSIHEALVHGGIAHECGVDITWISSDRFTDQETAGELFASYDGLLVPGGFGIRGVEGMVEAIRWAREQKLPFLGICLGLQTAIVEFARNVCKIPNTNSSEFEPECENPVISLMRSQEGIQEMGGTMRLGAYPCKLRPGSRVAQIYGSAEVSERHRHRYEVSNAYRDVLAEFGMRCSGLSPDGSLVEMIELPDHPWFVGCQFHPELKSRPTRPHPLFAGFVGAARQHHRNAPARRHAAASGLRRREPARLSMSQHFAVTPFLIAGPCVVESDDLNLRVAEALAELGAKLGIARHLQGLLRQGESLPARAQSVGPDSSADSPPSTGCGPPPDCRSSPTCTRRRRSRRPRGPPTCCRSRRFSAARPTCWSPPAARTAPSTSRRASGCPLRRWRARSRKCARAGPLRSR